MSAAPALVVHLRIEPPVIVGLPALAILRIVNAGTETRLVSARLNLMEGDVGLLLHGPDGVARNIPGWQADTQLQRVDLPSGEQLVGALLLFETPAGPVFPAAGRCSVTARYRPASQEAEISSEAAEVAVTNPKTPDEQALATALAAQDVRDSLVRGETALLALRLAGRGVGAALPFLHALAGVGEKRDEADTAGPTGVAGALAAIALRTPFAADTSPALVADAHVADANEQGAAVPIKSLIEGRPMPAVDIAL